MSRKTASTSRSCSVRSASVAESQATHLADRGRPARAGTAARRAPAARRRRPAPAAALVPRSRGTPGANFGTRTVTLVPAPGAVSTTRPYSSPYVVRSRASTLPSPTESRLASPASARRTFSGSSPTPSSSTSITHSWSAVVRPGCVMVPAALGGLEPVPDGVLDQRLDAEERHRDGQHLGRDAAASPAAGRRTAPARAAGSARSSAAPRRAS